MKCMIVQCYSNSATKANMYAYYSYAVVFVMFHSQQIIWQIIFCNCLYLYSASIQLSDHSQSTISPSLGT